jgi:CRP/FNR family transcriptional regulator, cyclic AMP receptor protein
MSGTSFDVDVIASSGSAILIYVDGITIHRRGDEGGCAYIVKRGQVELRQKGHPVDTLGPGDIFGEVSVISDAPRLETAVAVGAVELLPIDRSLFDVLMRDDEDFAGTVMRLLVRRLSATAAMVDRCVGDLPAAGRTAEAARVSQ